MENDVESEEISKEEIDEMITDISYEAKSGESTEQLEEEKTVEIKEETKTLRENNDNESEIKFEEEIFVSSSTETTAIAKPEFKVTVSDEDVEVVLNQEGKNIHASEFSEKSRWRTRTDKSTGGASTASCEQIVVDYNGKTYSGIRFVSQLNSSTVKKLSSTLFINGIQLPDSLTGSKGVILKVIGDGNDYTLRIGVGNIEYGCKLKTKEGEVLLFDIPYKSFRQQTGTELIPLDPDEITGITLSPSVPVPGKYEITIFDMNAK